MQDRFPSSFLPPPLQIACIHTNGSGNTLKITRCSHRCCCWGTFLTVPTVESLPAAFLCGRGKKKRFWYFGHIFICCADQKAFWLSKSRLSRFQFSPFQNAALFFFETHYKCICALRSVVDLVVMCDILAILYSALSGLATKIDLR